MANNFFLSQGPLLFQSPYSRNSMSEEEARKQFAETMNQYRSMQQKDVPLPSVKDYLGELDTLTKNLNKNVLIELNNDEEYKKLNLDLTTLIQTELMSNIKWKINSNQDAIKNIERQTEIIKKANKKIDDEQRQSLNELNDYVKNYSNITFDEYRKIKNQGNKSKVTNEDK